MHEQKRERMFWSIVFVKCFIGIFRIFMAFKTF